MQVNEAMNSRDLECNEKVPDRICVRLADEVVRECDRADATREGPIARVHVKPVACGVLGSNERGVRCWEVEAQAANGASLGANFLQREDGSIITWDGLVVGVFPSGVGRADLSTMRA